MMDSGKQPLLLQLLAEQRKFLTVAQEMYSDKLTAELITQCQDEEAKRRANGARALPLRRVLIKKGALTDKEVEAAMRKVRGSSESFIPAKEMESFRRAQQEQGATLEKVLVKLGLASEQDIAGVFAEYLH